MTPILLFRRWLLLCAWPIVAIVSIAAHTHGTTWLLMFLTGAICQAYSVRFNLWAVAVSALLCVAALPIPAVWALPTSVFGTYAMLGIGILPTNPTKSPLPDISYGVYLYGWPIQKLLIFAGVSNPLVIFALAAAGSAVAGVASWYLVEKRFLQMKINRGESRSESALAVA